MSIVGKKWEDLGKEWDFQIKIKKGLVMLLFSGSLRAMEMGVTCSSWT